MVHPRISLLPCLAGAVSRELHSQMKITQQRNCPLPFRSTSTQLIYLLCVAALVCSPELRGTQSYMTVYKHTINRSIEGAKIPGKCTLVNILLVHDLLVLIISFVGRVCATAPPTRTCRRMIPESFPERGLVIFCLLHAKLDEYVPSCR